MCIGKEKDAAAYRDGLTGNGRRAVCIQERGKQNAIQAGRRLEGVL